MLVLSKEGCNPCARVKRLLDEMANEDPALVVEVLDLASTEGTALALQHSILYPPAVFVEGRLVGYGKIRESELRCALRAPPRGAETP